MNKSFIDISHGSGAVIIAGLAGGMAEVLWVGASAAVLGVDATNIAREVAVTVMPTAAATAGLGLAVHFFLSFALAAVFSHAVGRYRPHAGLVAWLVTAIATLASVWVVNFFLVLPWLNPVFTTLLPLGVTFVSKLLFALAMWGVFSIQLLSPGRPARGAATRSVVAS